MENCIVCDFELKQISKYVYKCNNCSFFKSILTDGYGREVEGISELRKCNFRKIIKVIKSYSSNKIKILEIGSGNGFFIEECKKNNIEIVGSEPDEKQFKILKEKFSNIIKLSLPIDESVNNFHSKFDYVAFNDVFEHLKNLDLVLKHVSLFLKDDGKILINLPSSEGLIFKLSKFLSSFGITSLYDRLWQKNLSSPHLSYFNNQNLKKFLNKHGYEQIYSGSLKTVNKLGNFERLNSTIKNKFLCFVLSIFLYLFYYFQRILPKDIIFHIYEKNHKPVINNIFE